LAASSLSPLATNLAIHTPPMHGGSLERWNPLPLWARGGPGVHVYGDAVTQVRCDAASVHVPPAPVDQAGQSAAVNLPATWPAPPPPSPTPSSRAG
jgi:hypothetical protein